jgi:rhodanese-related sulfurtransferase
MNRALFLLALAFPLAPRSPEPRAQLKIEIVGPSVLMNHARQGKVAVFDLRAQGRRVPHATRNLAAPVGGATVFALGEFETARKWAEKRALKSVWVVMPHMIEFETMHNVPQIEPREAWERVSRESWPLFDISEAVEFAESRLARSQRLDYSAFGSGKMEDLPKNRPFIVACRVGHRSQLVTQRLRALGYDARNLNGGLWEWQCQNLPMEGERR